MAHEALSLLGVVQVPVANLYFVKDIGGGVGERQHSKKQVQHLETLFSKTTIDHEDHRHWIDGYVDQSDVPSILGHLGGSITLHQSNAAGFYPYLTDQRVAYTHGRHRVEASQRIDPQSCWTIFLCSTDLSMLARNRVVQRRTEQFHHEERYTDGYIYSKLREHPVDSLDYDEWYMRLSLNKQKNFEAINKHSDVAGALDRLIGFPGIIDALRLGNFRKYSAWGLFSEAHTCLDHIYSEWSGYTLGNRIVQKHLTPETVKLLEGRAPAISRSDHEWVRAVFQAKMVFPAITDQQQRDQLEKKILGTSGMIPSLRIFQGNMLYLGIAAQVVWSLLIPSELKKTTKAGDGPTTLQSALRECWVETEPYVEIREGEFQPVLGRPSFNLAYNAVIVAALRQFAFMARDGPKVERGEPATRLSTDDIHSCESLFQRRAKLVGFRNYVIEEGATNTVSPFKPEKHALESDEHVFLSRVEHRWGRPFARMFPVIQEVAFLPRLFEEEVHAGEITEAFVLKDMVRAFLPHCSFNFDLSRPSVHINSPVPEVRVQPVHSNSQTTANLDLEHQIDMDSNDYHGFEAESTEMDVDTPPALPVAPVFEDEDVPMEDQFIEPAATEITEYSDFWEQLLLEYQTRAGTSSRSSRLPSDTSTLVLDDLNHPESLLRGSTARDSSSAISIPSYSLVADQSRTLFDYSAGSSQLDGSTLWSLSDSENDTGHQARGGHSRNMLDYTEKSCTTKAHHKDMSAFLNGRPPASHHNEKDTHRRKDVVLPAPQLHKPLPPPPPPPREDDRPASFYRSFQENSTSLYAPRHAPSDQNDLPARVGNWLHERPPLPSTRALPSPSRQDLHLFLASVYSTSPERSVLPSPSSGCKVPKESQAQKVAPPPAHSNHRPTYASFYTAPHPRSTLPSPRGRQPSRAPRRRAKRSASEVLGYRLGPPWKGASSASVSADSQLCSVDLSGNSQILSHSSMCSPILSRFNAPAQFPVQSDSSSARSPCMTPGWVDGNCQVAPTTAYCLLLVRCDNHWLAIGTLPVHAVLESDLQLKHDLLI
ncbi:hypothetical protein AUP68_06418 [Ilyonectria robusta]